MVMKKKTRADHTKSHNTCIPLNSYIQYRNATTISPWARPATERRTKYSVGRVYIIKSLIQYTHTMYTILLLIRYRPYKSLE